MLVPFLLCACLAATATCMSALVKPLSGSLLIKRRTNARTRSINRQHSNAFTLIDSTPLANYNLGMETRHMKHEKSGAEYFHILSSDNAKKEKTLSLVFKTPVTDLTGMSNCVQKMVLRVKDRRCTLPIRNEIQAVTRADHTKFTIQAEYPDEYNELRDKLLKSCFQPELGHQNFRTNVWRMDVDRCLAGRAYSDAKHYRINTVDPRIHLNRAFFKGSLYEHNPLGSHFQIPFVKPADVEYYQRKYYRPENALFIGVGDEKLMQSNLDFLDNRLSQMQTDYKMAYETAKDWKTDNKITFPHHVTILTGPEHLDSICVAWKTSIDRNNCDYAKLALLDHLIFSHGLGILRNSFKVNPTAILSLMRHHIDDGPQKLFGVQIIGTQVNDDQILQMIDDSLRRIIKQGLAKHGPVFYYPHAQAFINLRRASDLVSHVADDWAKLLPLTTTLSYYDHVLMKTAKETQSEEYAELIKTLLIDNPNCMVIRFKPDPHNRIKLDQIEREFITKHYDYLEETDWRHERNL